MGKSGPWSLEQTTAVGLYPRGNSPRGIADMAGKNADQYVDFLKKRCENLAEFPDMGRDRKELAPDLQSFPIDNYTLFYIAIDEGIDIIRVLNAARDIPALLALR